ncbi:hypothetical protein LR48_Vigan06g109600 [Vigna angularis]|uniref:Uncharacterized protein n=1 Tax=Phaseolus angularis TaxID=3914 RepID=A0A0L9USD1_PHAAN|nr:hypothetical protein LR48_Vigan06g109600 [Vigna angularis]
MLEGKILASRNVVLEPLETRLSFPVRKPQTEPRTRKGERKERTTRHHDLPGEYEDTVGSRSLHAVIVIAICPNTKRRSPLLLAGRTRVEERNEKIASLCKTNRTQ